MSCVRDLRMMLDSSFDNISDKQIVDKIRGFWRYPRTKFAHEPPNAQESLNCKFQRLESNENMPINESTESEYESDTSKLSGSSETSAHISNSIERNSLFSEKDKKIIKILCAKLIVGGKIHKDTARYCLRQNMDEKKILKKFTFVQICTRLYNERNLKSWYILHNSTVHRQKYFRTCFDIPLCSLVNGIENTIYLVRKLFHLS